MWINCLLEVTFLAFTDKLSFFLVTVHYFGFLTTGVTGIPLREALVGYILAHMTLFWVKWYFVPFLIFTLL